MHSKLNPISNSTIRVAIYFAVALLANSAGLGYAQIDRVDVDPSQRELRYDLVAITKDQKYLVAFADECYCVWDRVSGQHLVRKSGDFNDPVINESGERVIYWDYQADQLMEIRLSGAPNQWPAKAVMGGFEQDVEPLALSDDSKRLACKFNYEECGVIDLEKKSVLMRQRLDSIFGAAFSPRADRVSFSCQRDENAVVSFSIDNGESLADSAGFIGRASHIEYSPDGDMLAVSCTMSGENSLVLLDANNMRPLRGARFQLYSSPSSCVIDWSDDGSVLAVSGAEGGSASIGLFDAKNLTRMPLLRGHYASSLMFGAADERLYSVSDDEPGLIGWDWKSNVRFRDATAVLASHPRIDKTGDGYPVHLRLEISPDGKTIALAVPSPRSVNAEPPLQSTEDPAATKGIDFSRLDHETAYVFFIDLESGRTTKAIVANRMLKKRDGSMISGRVFDRIAFSPDGQSLASLFGGSTDSDSHLIVWDMQSQTPRVKMLIETEYDTWREGWLDLAYTPEGQSLLLLPYDSKEQGVQVLDLATTTVTNTIKGELGPSLLPLAGGQVASGFATWDYVNAESLYRENTHYPTRYDQLAWARDNSLVGIYSGSTVGKWSLETLKISFPFAAHGTTGGIPMHALTGTKGGELIATGGNDGMIRVWDPATAHLLVVLRGHQRPIDALCFTPDGQRLVSASRDGTTRIWVVGDLASGRNQQDRPNLPTHRAFDVAAGAKVTVSFDSPAANAEIVQALQQALEQAQASAAAK